MAKEIVVQFEGVKMPSIEIFHKHHCDLVLIATIKFYLNGAKKGTTGTGP